MRLVLPAERAILTPKGAGVSGPYNVPLLSINRDTKLEYYRCVEELAPVSRNAIY
jgi:hypothetical protein